MNAGNPIGVGWAQATIGDGQRSSSSTSYLSSAYISRPNLSVLLNAEVTRVIQEASELAPVLEVQPLQDYQAPHFSVVEFESANKIYTVRAKKEVILW
jgi:choline dehydrogenase-like flavoprotein